MVEINFSFTLSAAEKFMNEKFEKITESTN